MSPKPDYRSRLVAARERLGLTSRQMAARLLTPRQTYEQWESGARRTPGVAVVAAEVGKSPCGYRPPPQRNAEIVAAREEGHTYDEIAARHGLTKQRIQQIVKRMETQK